MEDLAKDESSEKGANTTTSPAAGERTWVLSTQDPDRGGNKTLTNVFALGMTNVDDPLIEDVYDTDEEETGGVNREPVSITPEFVRRKRDKLKTQLEELEKAEWMEELRTKLSFKTLGNTGENKGTNQEERRKKKSSPEEHNDLLDDGTRDTKERLPLS
ncbi:hypothetical protein L1987_48373 [Smallanthus sonchifolius]|uniref:Uncharacterized protein n=1 Tax=Smallanthus sonchifolius TaxID=185202 RepID=A0ACB9FRK5_9ASTR|nr:hypothetical protein L1987_48373 [Smallanthus sonchifolius]